MSGGLDRELSDLPGSEFIGAGLADLAAARETIPSLLVSIGSARLRRAGLDVPPVAWTEPEHRLYDLLHAEDPLSAHGRYNGLIRRLVSFERALERTHGR